jgi:hypothetical protein
VFLGYACYGWGGLTYYSWAHMLLLL